MAGTFYSSSLASPHELFQKAKFEFFAGKCNINRTYHNIVYVNVRLCAQHTLTTLHTGVMAIENILT